MTCWGYWLLLLSSWALRHSDLIYAQHLTKDEGIGIECESSEECQKNTPNTNCSEGMCFCLKGFSQMKKKNVVTCESNTTIQLDAIESTKSPPEPEGSRQVVDPKMIIIIVVLAIMFVGICVALHLFSKARFRNHRTIFNSPHPRLMHIKLGKKAGGRRASHSSQDAPGSRQLSICSQMSPLQTRRGSQAASNQDNKRQVHTESASGNSKSSGQNNSTHKSAQENSAKAKDAQSGVENADVIEPTVLQP